MEDFRAFFKDKKITVMGLGILGRGLGYTKFLAECGADLIVTDLKTKEQLETSIKDLSHLRSIKFVFGEHRLEDFRDRDMIIKSAGVPLDSVCIQEAKKNNIPVEMDVSLFAKLTPEVMILGVTGTRGKSMTTALIYEILKKNEKSLNKNVYIGGNVRGVATLPLLEKVKAGDILVCELDSWQLQGFGDSKISPHISVFTSFMPDHMNYYKYDMENYFADKANIFKYQKRGDALIIRKEVLKLIPQNIKSKLILADPKDVAHYKFIVPGDHQRENLACAVTVAKLLGISGEAIEKTVESFKGLEGRLQYVKTVNGVKIYNDNNATTPEATVVGIEALKNDKKRNIILICGGADKNLPLDNFLEAVNKYCKIVILIPGTGTDKLLNEDLKVETYRVENLDEAIEKALEKSEKGDTVLFSPAFASFGMFNNEYERNDLFMKIVANL